MTIASPRFSTLALFAKVPRAGTVKTRLVPPLTYAEAASLARAFIEDTSAALVSAAFAVGAQAVAFYAPGDGEAHMRTLLADGVRPYPQSGGDLGTRLTAAYRQLVDAEPRAVCFVGADSPTLPRERISDAFAALQADSDVVLGPATDGGCYLIGLRGEHVGVFTGIDWSTERVFAQMRARTALLGLTLTALAPWYDVDDAPSLFRLCEELVIAEESLEAQDLVERGDDAPRTRAFLASLARSGRDPRATHLRPT